MWLVWRMAWLVSRMACLCVADWRYVHNSRAVQHDVSHPCLTCGACVPGVPGVFQSRTACTGTQKRMVML
jgi:hypothetical protein